MSAMPLTRRLAQCVVAAVTCALLSLTTTATALADASPPIGWKQLGLSDKVDIVGADQPSDVEVPVPLGVVPTELTGFVSAAVNVVAGRVDVIDSSGVVLGSIPAPDGIASAPFSIDVSPARVADDVARLSFVLRDANSQADSCTRPPSITLSQLAVGFSGDARNPVTVADFLPGYLEQVIVRVGPTPSTNQQQAALDLVAEITRLYRPIPVRVDVDTSVAPLPPATPLRRVIELGEGGAPAMTVRNPGLPEATLAISGSGEDLIRQVALFADRRFVLAQSDSASVSAVAKDKPQATNIKTFGQLGMTGQLSVLGNATLYAGFDVANFGVGSIDGARMHLIAKYTPVVGGEATLVIKSGPAVVATHVLDESGSLDISGDIPAAAVTSTVGLAFELRYVPRQQCAPVSDRITFALDPASTIAVNTGTDNRGGFPMLPMAFTPDFDVVVDAPERIRYAAQAINLLAQQTGVVLQPHVTTMDAAATSSSGLLVVGTGDKLEQAGMTPPLLSGPGNTVAVDANPMMDVDLGGPIGVVQAFTQGGRSVLAVSAVDDWGLVDRSLDYVRGLEGRWTSLTGDVVATGAAGGSVNLTMREGGGMLDEFPGDGWKWWAVASMIAGAAALTTAVVATVLIVRRRRRPLP